MPVSERLQEDAVGLFEDGDFVLRQLLNTLETLWVALWGPLLEHKGLC